jgi:hypothetical protein
MMEAGTNVFFSFSWGSDEYGQLGHNQGAQTLRVPRLVKSLGTLKVQFSKLLLDFFRATYGCSKQRNHYSIVGFF